MLAKLEVLGCVRWSKDGGMDNGVPEDWRRAGKAYLSELGDSVRGEQS